MRIFTYLQVPIQSCCCGSCLFSDVRVVPADGGVVLAQDQGTTALAFCLLMMFFTWRSDGCSGQYGSRAKNLTVELGTETQRMIVATLRAVTAVSAFLIALILVVVFDNPALSM